MNPLVDRTLVWLIDLTYFLIVAWFALTPRNTRPSSPQKTLVMPASAKSGNLGDQAMLWGLYEFQERCAQTNDLHLCVGTTDESWQGAMGSRFPDITFRKVWGRFLSPLTLFNFARIVPQYSGFYLLGADTLDGYYGLCVSRIRLRILQIAALHLDEVKVLGFSFNQNPKGVRRIFKKLRTSVDFKARDPISQSRLKADSVESQLVADLAFIMSANDDPSERPEELTRFMSCDGEGGLVIGVNVNCLLAEKYETHLDGLEYALLELATSRHCRILIVPHDTRDTRGHTDFSAGEKLYTQLINRHVPAEKLYLLDILSLDCSSIKALVAQCDLLISGRMHLGIAALSQGVPTLLFDYQGKQRGMLQLLGLGDECLVQSSDDGVLLLEKIENLLGRSVDYKAGIEAKIPGIKLLSEENFSASSSPSFG